MSERIVYVVNGWDYNGLDAIYLNLEGSNIYYNVTDSFKTGSFAADAQALLAGRMNTSNTLTTDRLPLFWCQCARYHAHDDTVDWSMAICPGLDLEQYVGKFDYLPRDDTRYWRGKETKRG